MIPALLRALGAVLRGAWRSRQVVAAGLVLIAALAGLWAFALRTELFRITEVQVVPTDAVHAASTLIGRNIWDVNLRALADQLKAQYPHLKDIRVIRQLPNILRIEAIERVPVAQMPVRRTATASAWYPIDRDGFVVLRSSDHPREALIQVLGLNQAAPSPQTTQAKPTERMALALRIITRLRRARQMPQGRLRGVDVSDPRHIRLVLDDQTEVRCGTEEELDVQLSRLRGVLEVLARRSVAARYIDVRFEQPVIAPQPS